MSDVRAPPSLLPEDFRVWFARRGWQVRSHQLAMVEAAARGASALLVAPTGGGKTLAGFLPSLIDLAEQGSHGGLHTLYISPLKALTADIARNLQAPLEDMALPIRVESRTGDTSQKDRARQKRKPPDILLTTPESLALLLASTDAANIFAGVTCVVIDELHALHGNKRGDLLALGLSRLRGLSPGCRMVGLSATVADPPALLGFLGTEDRPARLIMGEGGAVPDISLLLPEARMPWAGHVGVYGMDDVYGAIKAHGTSLVFVNTRGQAERVFQELWRRNEDGLAIALHHASLDREQREKVEGAMAAGRLRGVVCTSSLDLGIDWGAVDLVIQVGAPKGVSRLLQRIGRANHRLDTPSKAMLLPANRFEVLECYAALAAIGAHTLDGPPPRQGGLDVLAQHIIGTACAGPFDADALWQEVRTAAGYQGLTRATFDAVLAFVAHGGYALRSYERFHKLTRLDDGRYTIADQRVARSYRMNIGVIIDAPTLKVKLKRQRGTLGEIEEYFVSMLEPGDTFVFAGRVLRFETIRDNTIVECTLEKAASEPMVPAWVGGKFPMSTHLAMRVRAMLAEPARFSGLPLQVQDWLSQQQRLADLPRADELLVETFPRGSRWYLIAYGFAGRNAHQTLGMLLTKRMTRNGTKPMGFVCNDYALSIWSIEEPIGVADLFDVDILGDELEEWMAESHMLKRTFRNCAVVAGLIERRAPGEEKTGRQVTFNADLIYDVLRKYEPDHILLQATRNEASAGLTDIKRLADMLQDAQGKVCHRRLDRVSPLAVPLLLEIGRERVDGDVIDDLLDERSLELEIEAGIAELTPA
ncbi:MAG: ligase-associated DNA damage response DEXH box helicase [Geminicoccaceae bacterium]